MNKSNLIEFFNASELEISSIKSEQRLLSLLILYQYHNIFFWYSQNKIKKQPMHTKLIEYKDELINMNGLDNIPFHLITKYISIIEVVGYITRYVDIDKIMKKLLYYNTNNITYKAIYIYNETNTYIIFELLDKKIISIDVSNLNIVESADIESSIQKLNIDSIYNYSYEIVNIIYRPHLYRPE
jgi:hypothetical protein